MKFICLWYKIIKIPIMFNDKIKEMEIVKDDEFGQFIRKLFINDLINFKESL